MPAYHIVMVISRFQPTLGGTEIQCRELSRALVRKGHRVTVLTERYDRTLPAQETVDGVQVIRLMTWGWPLLSSFLFAVPLERWLRAHPDFDILHAHMLAAPAIAALMIGRRMKKPVIVKIAGSGATGDFGTSRQHLYGHLKLWMFKRWAGFIACPGAMTYKEAELSGIPAASLRQIPNGVDTQRFSPLPENQKAVLRESLKLKAGKPIAMYAGRWYTGKGVEEILHIWESAPDLGWTLCLLIITPLTTAQRKRVEALGDRVKIRTGVRDTLPYYQAADLAILLSENEGISNFLLEAMACGLPVITTPTALVGTRPEAEAAGWVMKPLDTPGLAGLLRSLRNETTLRGVKGTAGRHQITERFSTDKVADQYETLYEEAINVRDLRRR